MTRASSNTDGYVSAHSDGTPGLEYYADDYAFSWTGNLADPIEVAYGGYGEAVSWLIRISDKATFEDVYTHAQAERGGIFRGVVAWFQAMCDRWLDEPIHLEWQEVTLP